jgi:DNA/RNA-binding domain of Phe-tRNA-synthetase-like protein
MSTPPPSFAVVVELPDWDLLWARLRLDAAAAGGGADVTALRREVSAQVRESYDPEALAGHPVVAALRRLFRAAGCDPTRYRPSSEALLRRVLKGEDLPAIQPLVDLNNCLSVLAAVPSCVMAEGSITPPLTLRVGRADEEMASLRGPLNLQGKPLLTDAAGPFGTPITDSERVRVRKETAATASGATTPRGR